jgi:hypothetical protein
VIFHPHDGKACSQVTVVRHGDVGFHRHGFAAGRGDGRRHLLGL